MNVDPAFARWLRAGAHYASSAVADVGEAFNGEAIETEVMSCLAPAREAGDGWGLRYDECFAIEAAYQRRRMEAIEARLAALEGAAGWPLPS